MKEQENVIVKSQLENYSFLYVKLFLSIPKTKQWSAKYRNYNDYLKNDSIKEFFTNINNIIQNHIKNSFCKIRMNFLKKEILTQIMYEILQN